MQERHVFEYAVIRVVPCVEREEFLNVGVILFCQAQSFLHTLYDVNEQRLLAFAPELDLPELRERLQAFERICKGGKDGGAIGQMPLASRFRWLTAARSTVVQTSAVHPGTTFDAAETVRRLFAQLVQPPSPASHSRGFPSAGGKGAASFGL